MIQGFPFSCRSLGLIAGCALLLMAPAGDSLAATEPENWSIERFHWRGEVAAGTPIEIANSYGDLRLRGYQEPGVDVSAVLQHQADLPASLEVHVEPSDGKLLVEVREIEREGEDVDLRPLFEPNRRVDLVVFVPAGSPLVARTTDALLEGKGLANDVDLTSAGGNISVVTSGRVKARSEHGEVKAILRALSWSVPPSLKTLTGDIRLELPQGGNFLVTATTTGEVTTDYSIEIQRRPGSLRKEAVARIGTATQPVSLRSENGNLRILESPVPLTSAGDDD